ncbi:MAG: hypothetical protein IPL74_14535 [Bacteroidetes bacterium]|nr:hypothetical protein [Bacteroidota bacterium]
MVTPILGAIVRYKAQALPFLIIFLLLLTFDRSKKLIRTNEKPAIMQLMEWILLIGFTAIFSFIILKWNWFGDPLVNRYIFVLLFCLKIGAGIFAGQLYQSRYGGGDSWTLFNNSKILTNSVRESPADFVKMIIGVHDDEEFMEKYGKIRGWNNMDVVYNDNRTSYQIECYYRFIQPGFLQCTCGILCIFIIHGINRLV